ncbi:MAG: PP2C family protein-serine/threonine phosphatase, partial [candidate division KSB1 bacterium]|nr:PP2C family protein-serine/threonine phosphatase [candidate division KSB1 bacterium]
WVAKTGEPLNVPDVSKDNRFYAEPDRITGFTTRSILAVPLKVKNKVIGVAEVINPLYGDSFTEDDLELFSTFGRQVALAIENARMHRQMLDKQKLEQQLESAFSIQQSFMPQTFPRCSQGRFTVWARYLPATSVGGDFYDFIEFEDDQLGVVIGDVSGKGIPAALYMARLVSDFRFHSQLERDPARTLKAINELLVARSRRGMFVTLQYLILEPATGNLKITNAGHLPPVWLHQNGQRVELLDDIDGAPLGIKVGLSFHSRELNLSHGDSILLFTDGIIEARNKRGNRFSMKQLLQISRGNWQDPQRLVDTIIGSVSEFSQGVPQHDDITVVALTWH